MIHRCSLAIVSAFALFGAINLSQASSELLRLRPLLARGQVEVTKAQVVLIGENGWEYSHRGPLLFTDATVDPVTAQRPGARAS